VTTNVTLLIAMTSQPPKNWPKEWRHADPFWADVVLDIDWLCVESDAKRILPHLMKSAFAKPENPFSTPMEYEIVDLLQLDEYPLEDLTILWQPVSHNWTQIDQVCSFNSRSIAQQLSRELSCKAFAQASATTCLYNAWTCFDSGELTYDFIEEEDGVDASTPLEKRPNRPPETVFTPDRIAALYAREPETPFTDVRKDERRIRLKMLNEFHFFVGCYALCQNLADVWNKYGKHSFSSAIAIETRMIG